jgi:hypothetical protein
MAAVTCGRYRGISWARRRICDVFPALGVELKARWYFPEIEGEPTGDHFETQRELFAFIDKEMVR